MAATWQGLPPATSLTASIALALQLVAQQAQQQATVAQWSVAG